ncbi:MAG: BamA/TamA family outer membrane protein [Bacteroidales bacterium]|nr:BamA/TamA family outer membrane protein [Bacteroidales bacterium]
MLFSDGRRRLLNGLCLLLLFMGTGREAGRTQTIAETDKANPAMPAEASLAAIYITQPDSTATGPATANSGRTKFNIARLFSNTAGSANDPNFKPRKVAFVLGPGVYYSPSTSVAFTIGGQLYFDALDKRLTDSDLPKDEYNRIRARRSNLLIGLHGTIRSQFALELTPELYFLNRRLMLKGFIYTGYWPGFFWGIGGKTPDENKEQYNQIIQTADLRLTYDVGHGVFLGLGTSYFFYDILSKKAGPLTETTIPGQDLAVGIGPMVSLIYDTRNDNTRPLKGSLISVDANYNAAIKSYSGHFGKLTMDVRHYFHIPQKKQHIDHVFALNLVASSTVGQGIPFQELPRMADRTYARGIIRDRFIDRHMMALQAEYRFYWKWLGFAVFGCAGDVGPTLEEAWHFNKITYGIGLRVKPFRNLPFTIRGDMGFYRGKPEFYVGINELF